jgi:hypothetical protein
MNFQTRTTALKSALALAGLICMTMPAHAESAQQVTQYGITWRFDKPYPVGQFVTGDYWVVGPVKVESVSPVSGPSASTNGEGTGTVKSIYGAVSMQDDNRLRNGSMILTKPDASQGYDSRLKNYKPELSVAFPLALQPDQSLISTISNETFPTPVLLEAMMWKSEKTGASALQSAAVLTCLPTAPPADAFRPPYAGTQKPIYQAKNIRWDALPKLTPINGVPSWEQYERYFERPWLDHIEAWFFQTTGPYQNQANYGREFSRVGSIASLMLMLDVPRERKQKLLYEFVQFGIDMGGLAKAGRTWSADGGHWNGRKWPILFAGLMLGDQELQKLASTALFSEDQQTYFGHGAAGQKALYQIVFHTFPRPPYEEKDPATWDDGDKRAEGYRTVVSGGWPGTALAVQLMGAKPLWNHDAFFDYNDRWMSAQDDYAAQRGTTPRPKSEGHSHDPFVDAMWAAYRASVPQQPGAKENLKWEWIGDTRKGHFVPNPIQP